MQPSALHMAWERTLANKRRHDWAMIQFGASTEEVLERCWRGQEGEDSMGLDLDWDFRPLIWGSSKTWVELSTCTQAELELIWELGKKALSQGILVRWGWVKGSQTGSLPDLLEVCYNWLEMTSWFYACLDHKVEAAMNSQSKVKIWLSLMMVMTYGSLILKHFLWKGEAAPLNPYLAPVIRNKNRVTAP